MVVWMRYNQLCCIQNNYLSLKTQKYLLDIIFNSSLYPSSMISENISHDSKVWRKEYDLNKKLLKEWGEKNEEGNYIYDNLKGYQYVDVEYDYQL